MNMHTGDVEVLIGGARGTLRFDWEALAEVQTRVGKNVLGTTQELSVDQIAMILEIGFRRHNPEITAEVIKKASPPVMKMMDAIGRALAFAYLGAEGVADSASDSEPEDQEKKRQMTP